MSTPDLSGRPLGDTKRDRALFVDRAEPLEAIRATLLHRGNVLVLGFRGAGKSSLLRQLRHSLETTERQAVVLVEGRAARSTGEFLSLLRDRIQAWSRVRLDEEAPTTGQLGLWPPHTETNTLLAELAALRAALPEEETIVLVDELPSAEAARTLFGRLRDELWELPLIWCVAADERDRAAYTEPPADAFWRRIVELQPLTPEESAQLVRRRLPLEMLADEALDQIVAEAGGQPRRLLSMAHEVAVEGRDPSQVARRSEERERRVAELSEPARRLLAELEANGPASPSDQGLLQRLGWSRSRASQVFGELMEHDLVRATSSPSAGTRPRRVFEPIA
jgi:energy-coupling factor transporter ATP-binding protein EcfA2